MGDVDFNVSVDIELTNRCNAKCHFCPRDQTPHQGLMTPEVFAQSLHRAVEIRDEVLGPADADLFVNLCGLGEPLLNKHAATFVSQVHAAGIACGLSSNGALLDRARGDALLDAGLNSIFINVGDVDDEYESVYGLPFAKTRDNVAAFVEAAGERCEVYVVLVDHHQDPDHLAAMRTFWQERGVVRFMEFGLMNRGGSLFVDHMQYEALPEIHQARALLENGGRQALCGAPFGYLFIGYDGNYYLCCSDWKKEVPLGSVFDASFTAVTAQKLAHVRTREPICKTCNHDPLNRLTEELHAVAQGNASADDTETLIAQLAADTDVVVRLAEKYQPGVIDAPVAAQRRTIPVIAG